LSCLKPSETQITPLELVAPVIAIYTWAHLLQSRRILLFVDNQGAASAVSSGSSTQQDLQCLVTLFYVFMERLNIEIWVEWIQSDSNPPDEVSCIARYLGEPASGLQWPPWLLKELSYENAVDALFKHIYKCDPQAQCI